MYDVTLGIFVYIKQPSAPLESMNSSITVLKVQQYGVEKLAVPLVEIDGLFILKAGNIH
jgi:hypothetical protein